MNIMAIESSCDETAVAVVRDGREILSDCIASQVELHKLYGGVVPEIASRKHIEAIYGLADEALEKAHITRAEIDAIAVTYAPGLIGAVLVGVNFAKAAAYSLGVPLIPVHHMRGHIAANYLAYPDLEPPFICLVVSGGHSLIVDVQGYTQFRILGTTRDDAAGECFDKVARVLGMPYPGGAALDKLARRGDENKYPLPHTKLSGNPLDMSFSGLKTAALNLIHTAEQRGDSLDIPSLCASFPGPCVKCLCRAPSRRWKLPAMESSPSPAAWPPTAASAARLKKRVSAWARSSTGRRSHSAETTGQ